MKRDPKQARLTALAVFLFIALFSLHASAQNGARLAKISKVTTLVIYDETGTTPYGLSEARLRTVLELRLRTAGLRVLSDEEDAKDPDVNPYVMLKVATLETSNQAGRSTGFAYTVRLSVRTSGLATFNRAMAPLELWSDDTMGIGPKDSAGAAVERMVGELADTLLNQWLRENPKR
jgi:hypothetical protein